MERIGIRIKNARLKKGMSQEALAIAIGATKSTISKYELGRREPSLKTIQHIADALQVGFLDLVTLSGDQSTVDLIVKADKECRSNGMEIAWRNDGLYFVQVKPAKKILAALDALNKEGQQVAVDRVEELVEIPKYQRKEEPEDPDAVPKRDPES